MHSRFARIATFAVVAAVLVLGAALAMAEDQPAKPAEKKEYAYVGTKTCKMCHNTESQGKIYDKWMSTAHAKSMSVLDSAKGETKDPKCLKCHTTGYGTATGYDKVANKQTPDELGAVGCEACHGPGADYKAMSVMKDKAAAIAAGLVMPTEETCKTCHNPESPTFKSFDFAKMLPMIEHHIPKKAEEGK
jgi:mono/diheme cytochrome c family protein